MPENVEVPEQNLERAVCQDEIIHPFIEIETTDTQMGQEIRDDWISKKRIGAVCAGREKILWYLLESILRWKWILSYWLLACSEARGWKRGGEHGAPCLVVANAACLLHDSGGAGWDKVEWSRSSWPASRLLAPGLLSWIPYRRVLLSPSLHSFIPLILHVSTHSSLIIVW